MAGVHLPVLQRVGECNRCGDCCRGNPFTGSSEGYCPHVSFDGEGLATCDVHDVDASYWAKGCNVWPTKPQHVESTPRCSFRFEVK